VSVWAGHSLEQSVRDAQLHRLWSNPLLLQQLPKSLTCCPVLLSAALHCHTALSASAENLLVGSSWYTAHLQWHSSKQQLKVTLCPPWTEAQQHTLQLRLSYHFSQLRRCHGYQTCCSVCLLISAHTRSTKRSSANGGPWALATAQYAMSLQWTAQQPAAACCPAAQP
jgi:hypothetical protein